MLSDQHAAGVKRNQFLGEIRQQSGWKDGGGQSVNRPLATMS